jgi:hypothetical protein
MSFQWSRAALGQEATFVDAAHFAAEQTFECIGHMFDPARGTATVSHGFSAIALRFHNPQARSQRAP